jgi:hypothetical protein
MMPDSGADSDAGRRAGQGVLITGKPRIDGFSLLDQTGDGLHKILDVLAGEPAHEDQRARALAEADRALSGRACVIGGKHSLEQDEPSVGVSDRVDLIERDPDRQRRRVPAVKHDQAASVEFDPALACGIEIERMSNGEGQFP